MWYTFFLLLAILGFTTLVVSQWTVQSFEDRLTVQAENSVGVLSRVLSRSDLTVDNHLNEACTWLSTIPNTLEFRSVELIDESGKQRCYRTNTPQPPIAPNWFINNVEIEITPATQPVQHGWVTWKLTGIPYEANAYDQLWVLPSIPSGEFLRFLSAQALAASGLCRNCYTRCVKWLSKPKALVNGVLLK
jgi:hypothetical protein